MKWNTIFGSATMRVAVHIAMLLVGVFVLLGTCGCGSTSSIKKYDEKGNLTEYSYTYTSLPEMAFEDFKTKNICRGKSGAIYHFEISPMASDSYVPKIIFWLFYGDTWWISLKDEGSAKHIPETLRALKTKPNVKANATGIQIE